MKGAKRTVKVLYSVPVVSGQGIVQCASILMELLVVQDESNDQ